MKNIRYLKFMRRLCVSNRKARRPLKAFFELTYRCNHRCVHCYNAANGEDELSREEVFSVLDQLARMGTIQIVFTGGEIFTRPDITDILLHSRRRGLHTMLMTNGSLITDRTAGMLRDIGISDVDISFLGSSRETFDSITQVEGSYDKVVSGVMALRLKGIVPVLKACAMKTNMEELADIFEMARRLGASFGFSPSVIPRLDLDKKPTFFRLTSEECLDIKNRLNLLCRAKPLKPHLLKTRIRKEAKRYPARTTRDDGRLFNCMAGNTTICINPYGEIKPCLILPQPAYSIRGSTVEEGWDKIKRFVDDIRPPEGWRCASCEYERWCAKCPAMAYLNSGDIFGCTDHLKESARAGKEKYEDSARAG
ncbi:MAG: radical SAM protein [Candidatus Omnitrophota bacterium]